MKKYKILLTAFLLFLVIACSQDFGPGYRFELFRNTGNWQLAKAVDEQDTVRINALLKTGHLNIDLREPKFGRTLLLLAVGNDKLASAKCLLENHANVSLRDFSNTSPIMEASYDIAFKKNTVEMIRL